MEHSSTQNTKIRVGIAGSAGYTGGELLRLLVHHPNVELVSVVSTTHAGEPFWSAHPDLLGQSDLLFDKTLTTAPLDVLFLCLGHGVSANFLNENNTGNIAHIIDLSQDFRHKANCKYRGTPERDFLYALPESYTSAKIYAEKLAEAGNVANPGCFATAIQLALLPLAGKGLLQQTVHVQAITGATGAGAKLAATGHFAYRQNNISVYKPFEHQHLKEIQETLATLQSKNDRDLPQILFIPMRGDFARGIFASIYTECDLEESEAVALYESYYKEHPFVKVAPFGISLKEVVHTNNCFVHVEKHGNLLYITSAIDNLLKGASGTAVQNMNLLMGLDQTTGLSLSSISY